MNKKVLYFILSFLLLFIAAGCTDDCSPSLYPTFLMYQDEPLDGALINDLSPHFSWHHEQECKPEYTRLTISNKIFPNNNVLYRQGHYTGWDLNYDLEPGGEYTWSIAAYQLDGGVEGPETGKMTFFTGPVCTGNEVLQAPVIKAPYDGEWLQTNSAYNFKWYYPGNCLPDGYAYQFALDPQFTYPLNSGVTSGYEQHVNLSPNFPDCSTIYWRVAAKIGNSFGPYSAVNSFVKVVNPDCWQMNVVSPTMALIRGQIYLDECGWTGWPLALGPQTLPVGCEIKAGFGIVANGTKDASEPRLRDVVVDLGAGPCPSTGLDQDNAWKTFKFIVQLPGTYCITVSKSQPQTPWVGGSEAPFSYLDLNDGTWSDPLTHNILAQETITLQEGINIYEIDIGWDEYDQLFKTFEVEQDSFCRSLPSRFGDIVAVPLQGEILHIIGRNADNTWFEAVIDGKICLISTASGKPADDVDELRIFDPYPDPRPTQTPTPNTSSKSCSRYSNEPDCMAAGCTWVFGIAGPGACTE